MTQLYEPRIIYLEHMEDNVLTNAISVTLQDPASPATFGIRESITQKIVVQPNAPTVRIGTGQYEYNIDSLNTQLEYEVFWKVINSHGDIEFLLGVIPIVVSVSGGDGPKVPAALIGTGLPIDCDLDGYTDGYKYDIDRDGYYEAYDFDGDGTIDQYDVGKVRHLCGSCGTHYYG